jgi:hypothetical protein
MWRRPLIARALSVRGARDYSERIAARRQRNETLELRLTLRLKVKSGTLVAAPLTRSACSERAERTRADLCCDRRRVTFVLTSAHSERPYSNQLVMLPVFIEHAAGTGCRSAASICGQ